jgi:hypothetical protein
MGQKQAAYNNTGALVAFYDTVDSPAPAGVSVVNITDAEWQACINAGTQGYTVADGVLTPPPAKTDAELLAEAKSAKVSELSTACAAAITAGFTSSALGTAHSYPSKTTDQQNLTASVADALTAKSDPTWSASTVWAAGSICVEGGVPYLCVVGGTTGATEPAWPTSADALVNDGDAQWELWTTEFWCADATGTWAWTPHTAAQIIQVGRDIKAAILRLQAKNAVLAAKVAACETIADVQAIVWA